LISELMATHYDDGPKLGVILAVAFHPTLPLVCTLFIVFSTNILESRASFVSVNALR